MKTAEQIKTDLTNLGAKVWEKGSIKRIYVKSTHIKSLIDFDAQCEKDSYFEKNTKSIFSRINSEGAWFDLAENCFDSKKPSVRCWLQEDLVEILNYAS